MAKKMIPVSKKQIGRLIKAILIVALVAICAIIFYPIYCDQLPRVTPWDAVRAKQNASLVHVGMTDAEVWSTLGLEGYKLPAQTSGSGKRQAWHSFYRLWPGYVIYARWNLTTRPATLIEFKFQN